MNVFGYLKKYGNKTIFEESVNDIDQMIFAQLSYLNFEHYDNLFYRLQPLYSLVDYADDLSDYTLFPENNKRLFFECINSKRFKNIWVGHARVFTYRNVSYFSVLFRLHDKYFISFRGTDVTIGGWRENLNMLIKDRMPSHEMACDYTKFIMDKYPGNFYINGHSKGGNLAVFSLLSVGREYQDRIIKVYDFDGPGFLDDIYDSNRFMLLKDKVIRYVPSEDTVGILLNHNRDCLAVKSSSLFIMQHDLFSWKIIDKSFDTVEKTNYLTSVYDESMCRWINGMTIEDKKNFLRLLNEIFIKANIDDVLELKCHVFRSSAKLVKSYLKLDP